MKSQFKGNLLGCCVGDGIFVGDVLGEMDGVWQELQIDGRVEIGSVENVGRSKKKRKETYK